MNAETKAATDDLKSVCDALGGLKPADPAVIKRVQERADRIKRRLESTEPIERSIDVVREIRDAR